jgi:hypothetical protein
MRKRSADLISRPGASPISANLLGGIMTIVAGLSLQRLAGPPLIVTILTFALIVSGYAFALSLPLGAWVGQRGLEAQGPPANLAVFAGNAIGSVGALVGDGTLRVACGFSIVVWHGLNATAHIDTGRWLPV